MSIDKHDSPEKRKGAGSMLLAGFKEDATTYEDRPYKDPHRYLYCHKNLGKDALPRCRFLERTFNDTDFADVDMLLPPNFAKPPQAKSHTEYKLQAIKQLIAALNWWVQEQVDPESWIFGFYAYSYGACQRRAGIASVGLDSLITEFNYSHPAIATELKNLWDNLKKEAKNWDSHARIRYGQPWIDVSGSTCAYGFVYYLDPIEVKAAAGALLYKLRVVGSLVSEEQQTIASKAATKEPSRKAIQCYRLHIAGRTQIEIAKLMKMKHQGSVSKYLKQVKKYVEAGNILPDLQLTSSKSKSYSVNPRKLDYQEKPDGKVRPRKSRLQYDTEE